MKHLLVVATLCLAACGSEDFAVQEPTQGRPAYMENGGLRWGSADDPSLIASDFTYRLASLPLTGQANRVVWPGSYWPTYQDSINYKWDITSDAPSTKYGRAFGVANIENQVSAYSGIDAHNTRTECTDSSVCRSELGETCAKRTGASKGRCLPTWWGICHAWAPAAIMEEEPRQAVLKNGVTFKVNDIKALVTLTYDRTTSRFISLRCDKDDGQNGIKYDAYGRPIGTDSECMDTNPGTFHVVATNLLGLRGQSFVEDRTFDDEVWNQPMRSYRVSQQTEVTAAQANTLIGAPTVGGQNITKTGTVARDGWAHLGSFAVAAGAAVKVTMTGTGDADLYVRYGSEPTATSYDCRPYAYGSSETCELAAPTSATKIFVSVHGYDASSNYNVAIAIGGSAATGYAFNPDAVKLVQVKMESSYIGESSPSTDGPLASVLDRYTHTDSYEYILELDLDGDIIGGEWVGASKRNHPDFLWLPTGRQTNSVVGGAIQYANVKALLDASLGGGGGGGGGSQQVTKTGTVAADQWAHFGPFAAASGNLRAVLSGTGDADLYVRKGAQPTASTYNCRPYLDGSNETCEVAGPGDIYVSVRGYAASSNFSVQITYQGSTGGGSPTAHLNVAGQVALGESRFYTLAVKANQQVVVRTAAPADVDLYTRMNSAPTLQTFEQESAGYTGNEMITVKPLNDGTLHIMVHGYQASSFTLTTADN